MSSGKMTTTARSGDGPLHTTDSTLDKPSNNAVNVPVKEIDNVEAISLGYRQEVFSLEDDDNVTVGSMCTGAGYGTDAILLQWGDRLATIKGRDLLRAWVTTFAPDEAERVPT
jgi:hypothetical protein